MNAKAQPHEELAQAVAEALQATIALIHPEAPEHTDFHRFGAAWDACYHGPLHQLELHLMKSPKTHTHFRQFLVAAHNMDRLMEVLRLELGSNPLDQTRIPERINDLVVEAHNVARLLDEAQKNGR